MPSEVRRCLACGVGYSEGAGELPAASWLPSGPARRFAEAVVLAQLSPLRRACPPPADLLDLGAGSGLRSLVAARAGYRVVALEPDPGEAARARTLLGTDALVVEGRLEETSLPRSGFDAVVAWHVLEHVPDLDQVLRRVAALLRPGGLLVIALPNPAGLEARIFRSRWHGWEPGRHRWHLDARRLGRRLRARGFIDVAVHARGGWGYPASLAFSVAPDLDPQLRPSRAIAGRMLATALIPAAAAARAAGAGAQLVATARRPTV